MAQPWWQLQPDGRLKGSDQDQARVQPRQEIQPDGSLKAPGQEPTKVKPWWTPPHHLAWKRPPRAAAAAASPGTPRPRRSRPERERPEPRAKARPPKTEKGERPYAAFYTWAMMADPEHVRATTGAAFAPQPEAGATKLVQQMIEAHGGAAMFGDGSYLEEEAKSHEGTEYLADLWKDLIHAEKQTEDR